MIAESTLRELGATIRTFWSVKGAMLFLQSHLDRKLSMARSYEVGRATRSTEERHRDNATAAKVSQCTKGLQHVGWLVCWYEGDGWGDGSWLAEKAGLSRWAFTRRCRKTERELRRRMEDAGLLEDRDG